MTLPSFHWALYGLGLACALLAPLQGVAARRHWPARRRVRAWHRSLWSLIRILILLGLLGAGTALLG